MFYISCILDPRNCEIKKMEIFIIIALILLNGVLSMSEIALVSARKSKLETDARKGRKSAKVALKLANEPDRFLSTIQIGITLIGILTGLYSGDTFAKDVGAILQKIDFLAPYSQVIAQTLIVIVVTYLTLIVGELVPKRIGMSAAEKVSMLVAKPMSILSRIAAPFVWLLMNSTAFILKIFGLKSGDDGKVTEEEIKAIIREGTEDGEVQEVEQNIVERVFNLGDRNVGSIMTHRNDLAWVDVNDGREGMRDALKKEIHSIYPVSDNRLDNVLGVVFLKDIFGRMNEPDVNLRDLIVPPHYMPETLSVYNALEKMKKGCYRYGLVTDEFGSIQGIVTINDITEALIGTLPEIGGDPDIVIREDGSALVDGQCSFYDFLAHFDMENMYSEYNYNTLSGLILGLLEHIPKTGEKLGWLSFTFEIVDMDAARIDKILVTKNEE